MIFWYPLSNFQDIPPFTEFPSVLRFFRDGIAQANAAPVTSSLQVMNDRSEGELQTELKTPEISPKEKEVSVFDNFQRVFEICLPFFACSATFLLRGFFAPFSHLPTPRKHPRNWKMISKNDKIRWKMCVLFQSLQFWAFIVLLCSSNWLI